MPEAPALISIWFNDDSTESSPASPQDGDKGGGLLLWWCCWDALLLTSSIEVDWTLLGTFGARVEVVSRCGCCFALGFLTITLEPVPELPAGLAGARFPFGVALLEAGIKSLYTLRFVTVQCFVTVM